MVRKTTGCQEKNRKRDRRPVAVDFFCGAGGMSLGFEQAGFDVVWASDVDGHHVATHERNFPNCRTVCKPIEDFKLRDIEDIVEEFSEIDLVFGGPPCQGFSNMGLRDGQDPRNTLVGRFARVIESIRPRAFVMENVPGMLAGDTRGILDQFVGELKDFGYAITEPVRVLDASDFGVPQKRARVFVIGIRNDIGVVAVYPSGPCKGQPARPTVIEAIADLPRVDLYEELFKKNEVAYDQRPKTAYAKVARSVEADPSDYSHPRGWDVGTCSGVLRVRHFEKTRAIYAATPPGETVPGHKLPRLDPDGIAPTLRAGSDSTHGSHTAPRPIHPCEARCVTVREAARLHGYPDWFAFYPIKWHSYRQIGNSVCPPVTRAVGREILRALGLKPYKPTVAIPLRDDFVLPENRRRSKRRIPHTKHYPPVIRHLFENAYDSKNSRLWRSKFTFQDVEDAIDATGVKLPWAKEDTFLSDIARSRNVSEILRDCLFRGYSIRQLVDKSKFIGEFVLASESETIEKRDSLNIRMKDIADAVEIPSPGQIEIDDPSSYLRILKESKLLKLLWGQDAGILQIDGPLKANGSGVFGRYRRYKGKRTLRWGLVYAAKFGTPPTYSRIENLAQAQRTSEILVLVPVTDTHVHAIVLQKRNGALREYANRVLTLVEFMVAS